MAKIKAKTRKTVKARAAGARKASRQQAHFSQGFFPAGKKASVAKPKDVFRQPLEMLQNGFNSVMSYFK